MFGPFVHGLNKGGLTDILAHQRLRATVARAVAGGGSAVRGIRGTWDDVAQRRGWLIKPDPSQLYIEFETYESPDADGHPVEARWSIPEGTYLSIKVLRVRNGAGVVMHQSA